ncbi:MAG TPA: DUF3817 domain-containing protein [Actinomycetota bacterium]|nr:DUF3817 domain-containing protein [Actinomycetota bacterium]
MRNYSDPRGYLRHPSVRVEAARRGFGLSSKKGGTTINGSVARLRLVSLLETISFLALLTMMASESEAGVSVVGLVHGLLFLGYAVLVLSEREELGWTWTFAIVAIITGPVGAILVLERLRREGGIPRDEMS